MSPLRRFACFLCLQPDAQEVRFDKRGKPYLTCQSCGSRTFLASTQCWRGLAALRPIVAAVVERMETDPVYRLEVMRATDAYRTGLLAAMQEPDTQTPTIQNLAPTSQEHAA